MKIQSYQDTIKQATLYSLTASIAVFIVALLSVYVSDVSMLITIRSAISVFLTHPLLWILASMIILIPLATRYISESDPKTFTARNDH